MEWVAFILAVCAFGISLLALKRAGGIKEIKKEVEAISSVGESFRKKTADILDSLEKKVRGEEKVKEKTEEPPQDKEKSPPSS